MLCSQRDPQSQLQLIQITCRGVLCKGADYEADVGIIRVIYLKNPRVCIKKTIYKMHPILYIQEHSSTNSVAHHVIVQKPPPSLRRHPRSTSNPSTTTPPKPTQTLHQHPPTHPTITMASAWKLAGLRYALALCSPPNGHSRPPERRNTRIARMNE